MDPTKAANLIDSAVRTSWDQEFLANPRIKSWLIHEIAIVPFNPDTKTLLEYVKERMSAAEHLQAQQQQVQHATPAPQTTPASISVEAQSIAQPPPTYPTSTSHTLQDQNTSANTDITEQVADLPIEEDEQYTFGIEDFEMANVPENGSTMYRSPSPLPSSLSMPVPQINSSATQTFPFSTGQVPLQPFYQHQPSFTHIQQPSVLNPAHLYAQSSSNATISPSQLNQQSNGFINPSQATLQRQSRPVDNLELVVPQQYPSKRSKSPEPNAISPVKRQKTVSIQISPASTTSPTRTIHSPQSPQSALKPTPVMRPLSESEQVWQRIEADVARNLNLANKAPIGTVQKLFKLLSLFVTEPPNATKTGSREVTITDLSVPPHGRAMILTVLKEKTAEQFDQCLVTDPRATVLLAEWAKDLVNFAKGKEKVEGDEEALKMTARPLMEVFRKLPISLAVLRTLKGVGRNVTILSKSERFDEVTKDIASQLVKKWKTLAPPPAVVKTPPLMAVSRKRSETPQTSASVDADGSSDVRKKRKGSPDGSAAPAIVDVKPTVSSAKASTVGAPKASATLGTAPLGKALPAFAKRKPAPLLAKSVPLNREKPAPVLATAPEPVFNPFEISLQDMVKSKEVASGMSLNDTLSMLHSAMHDVGSSNTVPRAAAGKKAKKTVRWETDDKLEHKKIVEKLVYGDEWGNEIADSDYFNTTGETMGDGEGAALNQLAEDLEWETPLLVDFNMTADAILNMAIYPVAELIGSEKPEVENQTEREKGVLGATYFDEADIPPSPHEPPTVLGEISLSDDSPDVKKMKLSYNLERDEESRRDIAAIHGGDIAAATPSPLQDEPTILPMPQHVQQQQQQIPSIANPYQQPPQLSTSSFQSDQPHPASNGTPQDLNTLLAKLADPSAAMIAQQPLVLVAPPQPYHNYTPGPIPPPVSDYAPPPPHFGSAWDMPRSAPRSIDWNNVGSIAPDAYKRRKGGRR